jgi:hypothetical protein
MRRQVDRMQRDLEQRQYLSLRHFQMPGPIMAPISRISNVALQMILFLDSLKFVSWPIESRAVQKIGTQITRIVLQVILFLPSLIFFARAFLKPAPMSRDRQHCASNDICTHLADIPCHNCIQ